MIITIVSSDKLTLSMFSDFFKSLYSSDVKIVDLNCLYSEDVISSKMEEFLEINSKGRDVLIKYKIKIQTKEIPLIITDKSDQVFKFDIYSTEPEVIKGSHSDIDSMLNRWKMNIEKFNQQKI
jgi:hypothetical protein